MNLTDGLTEHLSDLTPPPPDLDRVLQRGEAVRRRRRATGVGATVLAMAVTGVVGAGLLASDPVAETYVPPIATGGPMDLSKGLRAYSDPGGELRMGGRSFTNENLPFLDTDATGTPAGVVFFRDGRPFLLQRSGASRPLWDGPVDSPDDWHPTAKMDRDGRHVAFAVTRDGEVTLVVADLETDDRWTTSATCGDAKDCARLVIDGIDSGTVFVRLPQGTFTWPYAEKGDGADELSPFAGATTRVADARNKTVLYDGPRPTVTLDGWTYVAGAIDAQLTFDGWNILSWSPVLKSVRNGEAITLQVPGNPQWFNVDTDGSILAATAEDPTRFFDCEVPSGRCEPIGRLQMTGGDPQFIGNDM